MSNRYGKLPYRYTPYGIVERRARMFRLAQAGSILAQGMSHFNNIKPHSAGFHKITAAALNSIRTMQALSNAMSSIKISNRKVVIDDESSAPGN